MPCFTVELLFNEETKTACWKIVKEQTVYNFIVENRMALSNKDVIKRGCINIVQYYSTFFEWANIFYKAYVICHVSHSIYYFFTLIVFTLQIQ